ncbi:uncharacterized protein LOC128985218 [Macrosteles quadrilineatus]|uniref:uncharacterized protein LOC128985218 n=1 Tax=Macrosteles quadrilineatus TaxID=74068 RepID=UPI0023E1E3D2|nr:uncharacterized protein LOC128985218 [Macrosteles quadrilineatus]
MESESDATVSPDEDGFMPHVEMIFKGRKKIDSDIEEAEDVEQPFQEMPEIGPEGDYQEPLHFVSREEWGALPPKDPIPNDKFPLKYVVYTMSTRRHTCLARADCIGVLQRLQKKHMNEGMSDIAYNFNKRIIT